MTSTRAAVRAAHHERDHDERARRDRTHRRGFALPAALMALVLIAALVAGALFMSVEELRAGRTDIAAQRALSSAEFALERTLASWDSRLNVTTRPGDTRTLATTVDRRGDSVAVAATRVHDRVFWITARGTSSADGRPIPARTTIAASARLLVPAAPLAAALTVGGAATVVGGTVDGTDATDSGRCPGERARDAAGIMAPDSTRVCGADCTTRPPAGVFGSPPVNAGAVLTSDSTSAGRLAAVLAARAQMEVAGGALVPRPAVIDGRCLYDDPLNWGDPTVGSACANHYPVIHITGNATLGAGAVGQGTLVIDGSLTVAAGARFDGVIVARNDVHVVGTGAEVTGVIIALDGDGGEGSSVRDGGVVRFRGCVARRAMLGAARLTRTPGRWWVELR